MSEPLRLQKADPIIGIRVSLNPIVRRPDGTEELLGEIAAEVLEVPPTWAFIRWLHTFVGYTDERGVAFSQAGPVFDMVP